MRKAFCNKGTLTGLLVLFEFVCLGKDYDAGNLIMAEPGEEFMVSLIWHSANIQNDDDPTQIRRAFQVFFNHGAPPFSHCDGDFGISVTRQINEVEAVIDEKEVYGLRAAWGGTGFHQILSAQEGIDQGRLAHIGTSCKSNLWPVRGRVLRGLDSASDECSGFDVHEKCGPFVFFSVPYGLRRMPSRDLSTTGSLLFEPVVQSSPVF